jgi:hypothetical protein
MSDVPELDRLLEEHDIFKLNVAWDRRERLFLMIIRIFILVFSTFMMCLLFGCLGIFTLFLAKFMWIIVPNPPFKDPFKRYNYM